MAIFRASMDLKPLKKMIKTNLNKIGGAWGKGFERVWVGVEAMKIS